VLGSRSIVVRLVTAALIAAVVGVACSGGGSQDTGGNGDGPDVEFLSGEVPVTFPVDFPIPDEAVVGTGMINRSAGTTELIIRIPATVTAVTDFFEANFAARGYQVTSSEEKGAEGWLVSFEKDGVSGRVEMSPITGEASQAVVRIEA